MSLCTFLGPSIVQPYSTLNRNHTSDLGSLLSLLDDDINDKFFSFPSFSNFATLRRNQARHHDTESTLTVSPNMDVIETDTKYIIKLDVPGISKENILIHIKGDNMLVIEGQRSDECVEGDPDSTQDDQTNQNKDKDNSTSTTTTSSSKSPSYKRHYYQRSFGKFKRQLQLPGDLNVDEAEAAVKDGVLSLTFTKLQPQFKEGVKKIKIN